MSEMMRRIVLAAGLLGGIWMIVWPAPKLFRLYPLDWEHERVRKEEKVKDAKRMMAPMVGEDMVKDLDLYPETRADRAEFIRKTTEGRLVTVQGNEWTGFFNGVAGTVLKQPPSREWEARNAKWPYDGSLYFRTDEPPLSTIADQFPSIGDSQYVCINGPERQEYLFVVLHPRNEVFRHAPSCIAFPTRNTGLWLMLGAFLIYAFFPRPSVPKEGLYYSRAVNGALPDAMGCVMAALFFVIPVIVPVDFSGDSPFDSGWNVMTGVCWLLSLLGLSMLAVAGWYMSVRLAVAPEGLAYRRLGVERELRWEDIDRVDGYQQLHIPPWLRKALFFVSIFNWRALGPALMYGGTQPGFRIILKDGTAISFLLRGLIGGEAFIGRLRQRGIPIAPEVYASLGYEPDDAKVSTEFPKASRGIGRIIFAGLILAGLAYLLAITYPPKDPVVKAEAFTAAPFSLPKEEKTHITWEILAKEGQILGRMREVRARMESVTKRMEKATKEERAGLQAEFAQLMEESQALHAELEAVGKPPAPPQPKPPTENETPKTEGEETP